MATNDYTREELKKLDPNTLALLARDEFDIELKNFEGPKGVIDEILMMQDEEDLPDWALKVFEVEHEDQLSLRAKLMAILPDRTPKWFKDLLGDLELDEVIFVALQRVLSEIRFMTEEEVQGLLKPYVTVKEVSMLIAAEREETAMMIEEAMKVVSTPDQEDDKSFLAKLRDWGSGGLKKVKAVLDELDEKTGLSK